MQVKIVLLIRRTAFCVFSVFSVHKFYNPQIKIKVVLQKLVVCPLSLNKILQNHCRKDQETRKKKIVLVTRHEFYFEAARALSLRQQIQRDRSRTQLKFGLR